MTEPATPLDNLDRINRIDVQLDRAARAIAATAARGEEFDRRIEETRSLVAENAKGNAELKQSIATTNAGINTLRKVVDDLAAESAETDSTTANLAKNFEVLLAEMRADRARTDARFEQMAAEARAEFNEQLAEIRALGEQNRALISALAQTNGRIDNLEQAG